MVKRSLMTKSFKLVVKRILVVKRSKLLTRSFVLKRTLWRWI